MNNKKQSDKYARNLERCASAIRSITECNMAWCAHLAPLFHRIDKSLLRASLYESIASLCESGHDLDTAFALASSELSGERDRIADSYRCVQDCLDTLKFPDMLFSDWCESDENDDAVDSIDTTDDVIGEVINEKIDALLRQIATLSSDRWYQIDRLRPDEMRRTVEEALGRALARELDGLSRLTRAVDEDVAPLCHLAEFFSNNVI